MRKSNKAVNYFLIILTLAFFSTLFVLAILIARGELLTTDGIVETGILKLEIEPKDANAIVYLDEELVRLSDKRINNLPAGQYTLRIEAADYSTWEKQIQVNNGIVKELYIRLFPTTQQIVQVTNSRIDSVFFSPDGEYAYYIVKDSELAEENGIWQLELTQNQIFFSKNEPKKIATLDDSISLLLASDYSIVGSSDGSKIILKNDVTSERMLLSTDEFPQQSSLQLVKDLLGFEPLFVTWLDDSNSLLVADHQALFEYDLQANRKNLIEYIKDRDVIFSANSGVVYYLDNSGKLMSYNSGNILPVLLKTKTLPTSISQIITPAQNPNVLLLQTADGSFVYLDLEHEVLEVVAIADAKFKSISADGSTIIFASKDKYMLYLADHILAENRVETSIVDPNLNVEAIENIEFNALSTHIVLQDSVLGQIRMAEKDGSNSFTLLEQAQPNAVYGFDTKARVFYILLVDEGVTTTQPISNLYKIELD
jgi:hypothetical protein